VPHQPASAALARFRVLDLTRVRSGPTCVRQLADWGCDVIKVEPPATDDAGQLGGPRAGSDFQNLQRNKRGITLNLKEAAGREVFARLVATADVVVENFRPDVKTRLGIDYASLERHNPRLVYASISGFGQDGVYAKRPGFDQIAQGMGGLMSITGEPGAGPMRVGIPIADLTAGLFAAQGILVALLERETSGRGQWLSTSLLEAQVFMLDFQATRWLMDGEVPAPAGNNHPTSIPTGVFRVADGHINIAVSGQAIWRRLCAALGHPEWHDDPAYATAEARSANRAELNAAIDEVTKTRPMAAWIDALNAAGVPAGPINTIDRVFADPQVRHLGLARDMVSTERGATQVVGQPVRLERTPSVIERPPPTLGEHNQEILADLGYDEAAIADLEARGVV
jgi:crotonobetainyl-CoA:carnitine CoA-transferase CaiB-like acyl-CoA transferase